jgi:hypothetical protein
LYAQCSASGEETVLMLHSVGAPALVAACHR